MFAANQDNFEWAFNMMILFHFDSMLNILLQNNREIRLKRSTQKETNDYSKRDINHRKEQLYTYTCGVVGGENHSLRCLEGFSRLMHPIRAANKKMTKVISLTFLIFVYYNDVTQG